ncbi:peptidylprolyl isomerase [Helicobacter salomonis]|uniref:peptidylprolyl isomerase n=1 Tax=Helicobacter salomonis TaxID=56878 RepID=UPI000CF10D5B|nr:peptidylprolyl isomerase [Helicobacter salomonis]
MITWMQKHKKYLVVTIWISTIAFVAAGMIGWGQYNFSLGNDSVAKVGQVLITQEELEMEYKRLVDAYSESIPDFKDLDAKQLQAMGLEKSALNLLINQAYLKNLALDLGVGVSNAEIIAEIQKSKMFQKDGRFDESLYKQLLQQNHYRPSAFEDNVRNALLVQKISALFPKATTPLERNAFAYPLKIQDRAVIKILHAKDAPIKIEESALKSYYEQHKDTYKLPTSYTLAVLQVEPDKTTPDVAVLRAHYQSHKSAYISAEGKLEDFEHVKSRVTHDYLQAQAKERALEQYLALKKGKLTLAEQTVTDLPYTEQINAQIEKMRPGEVLKPLEYQEGYMVLKLVKKSSNALKSFEQARPEVLATLTHTEQQAWLKEQARKELKNFKGSDIGAISPEFQGSIQELDPPQAKELVTYIFKRPDLEGFLVLKDKAVLYRIYKQDFAHVLHNEPYLEEMASNLKTQDFDQALVAMLRSKYPITIYAKSLQE